MSGPRFSTARLATGLSVRYAEQGDPGGEPIVFLHGPFDSWFSFSQVLSRLPAGRHAYAFDQRGHGGSGRPDCCYTVEDFAADAVAFLDAVGIERATLVGHSGSALFARRVAVAHPRRVSRLVLISSPAAPAGMQAASELAATLAALRDPVPEAFVRQFAASTYHVPPPEPFLERATAESLRVPARVWSSVFAGLLAFDDAPDLRWIAAPTLLLWGERDTLLPREEQQRLAAAIPNATLTVYPETGHSPHWERPDRVAADLEAFVAV